jgi:large subunit ribosomal protein L25
MVAKITLNVEARTVFGRKVIQLRRQGLIPGNVFGKKIKSFPIQLDAKIFGKIFKETGETSLLYLTLGDKKQHPVLISHIQKHPVTGDILHIDFRQVELTEKVTAMIPIIVTGESAAVKEQNGVLVQAVNEIEVEALPTDFPEHFTLDLSSLKQIGDSLLFKDLSYDQAKLKISLNPEDTLVTVKAQIEEKVEAAPVVAETPETPSETAETPQAAADSKPDAEK